MRRLRMLVTVSGSSRWLGCVAAGVAVLLLAAPVAATGSPGKTRASGGAFFGGFTAQDFPVVVEMNKSRKRVVRIGVGLRATCTSGAMFFAPDRYQDLKVSKKGRFSSAFADTERNDDGTTTDFSGSITGSINKAQTKVKGTWTWKAVDHDLAGAVTDTCEAATFSWSAKQ